MENNDLSAHKNLALDIDCTLIDHKRSNWLRNWLHENKDGRSYHLVTFRYGKHVGEIQEDLEKAGYDYSIFDSLHTIPKHRYQEYLKYRNIIDIWRAKRQAKFLRCCDRFGVDPAIIPKAWNDLATWKGEVSAQIGATILIDDRDSLVKPGCDKFGIHFLSTHKL